MRFSAPSFFTHTHSPDLSALLLCTWSQSICPYCPYSNTKSAIQVPNMQYKLYCSNAVDEACVLKQTKFRKKKFGAPSFFTHTHSPDLSALLLCTWPQSRHTLHLPLLKTQSLPFKCQTCNTSFTVQMQLKKHVC